MNIRFTFLWTILNCRGNCNRLGVNVVLVMSSTLKSWTIFFTACLTFAIILLIIPSVMPYFTSLELFYLVLGNIFRFLIRNIKIALIQTREMLAFEFISDDKFASPANLWTIGIYQFVVRLLRYLEVHPPPSAGHYSRGRCPLPGFSIYYDLWVSVICYCWDIKFIIQWHEFYLAQLAPLPPVVASLSYMQLNAWHVRVLIDVPGKS